MSTIVVGKRHIPLEHIALVEPFDPSAHPGMKTEKAFKARVVLIDRQSVLTEETVEAFAATHGFRFVAEDQLATNPAIRFGVENFEPAEGFEPTKPFRHALVLARSRRQHAEQAFAEPAGSRAGGCGDGRERGGGTGRPARVGGGRAGRPRPLIGARHDDESPSQRHLKEIGARPSPLAGKDRALVLRCASDPSPLGSSKTGSGSRPMRVTIPRAGEAGIKGFGACGPPAVKAKASARRFAGGGL